MAYLTEKEDMEILQKVQEGKRIEKEEIQTNTNKLLQLMIRALSLFLVGFHLYTAYFGAFQSLIQRPIHVCAGISLIFLYQLSKNTGKAMRNRVDRIVSLVIIAINVVFCIYILMNFRMIMAPNFRISQLEMVFAVLMILVVMEAARRSIGLAIPILATIAMAYALFGSSIPGSWGHNGIAIKNLLTILAFSDRGIWGSVTGVSATIIATFVIFGSVLFGTGGGQTFIDVSNAITGRSHGGAAKLAVVASALFGTVSGSSASNVATTGAFTIPMMKRLGYKSEFAAAVECSASSGGQIMPPIMGAGAFIMADLLGVPYVHVAVAAIFPALLYFFGVFFAIDCAARRYDYKGLPDDEVVPLKKAMHYKKSLPVFVPILLLIFMFSLGYTAVAGASYAIITAVVIYLAVAPKEFKKRIVIVFKSLMSSAKGMLTVLSLIACAQILVCLISVTGIGVKFSGLIMALGGKNMLLVGIMAMLACMILGMGMPTVAAYVLAASVIAPALVRIGVEPIAAHFFVFYYAIFAGLTPPVCGTVYVGSAMAESNWIETAFIAIRLSIGAFIVPFMFLYSPALLLVGSPFEIVQGIVTAIVGMSALAAAMMGYLYYPINLVVRAILTVVGIMMVNPGYVSDAIGVSAFVIVLTWVMFKHKRQVRIE